MKTLLGPILHAEDQRSPDTWTFSVSLYLAGTDPTRPLPLRLRFLDSDARELPDAASREATVAADFSSLKRCAGVLWKWTVALPRRDAQQRVAYRFEAPDGTPGLPGVDDVKDVVVPAKGALPRAAFFSCNGASDARTWNSVMRMKRPYGCWEDMKAQHDAAGGGFHLLIGGGDQVYADILWDKNPDLEEFRELALERKFYHALPPGFHEDMLAGYVALYCERWGGRAGIATLLSRVPGVYTWDDHDIFDGWGSHELLQDCDWYQSVYSAAALAFEAFQLGGLRTEDKTPRERKPCATHYLQTLRFPGTECDVDVVVLDLRSGRTSIQPVGRAEQSVGKSERPVGKTVHQVMSPAQWEALDAWRKEHGTRAEAGKKPRHVIVVSSVPLVHLRYGPGAEKMGGVVELRDDMMDQWESVVHRGERTRLMVDLFTLAKDSCCAVTVVSGDVHVGARGLMRSRNPEHVPDGLAEAAIEQVTSSGIVHPPPTLLQFLGMRMLAEDGVEDLPSFMQTEMLPVGGDRYLRERNWLSLRVEPARSKGARPKLWLRWEAEHTPLSMQVVVEPPPLSERTWSSASLP
ncbi:alkaline phosphatase D family protein [Pyxidicoccus sp. 3LG]